MTDIERVEKCLKFWSAHAQRFKYGGLAQALRDTQQAQEALERIKRPPLFDTVPGGLGAHNEMHVLRPRGN